jgi:Spy/CpxP family protein refolding chaperone
MKTNDVARFSATGIQMLVLIAVSALVQAQGPAPQSAKGSGTADSQHDIYAQAFAGLTYADEQKESISKIRQDIESRKAAVRKDDKLADDVKDNMLSGYMRIEYSLIYKELTPEQKKQVSSRMHALRAAEQAAQKRRVPAQ